MKYTWLGGMGRVTGTIEPITPAEALPAGQRLTADEKAAWKALWDARLQRGVGSAVESSVLRAPR